MLPTKFALPLIFTLAFHNAIVIAIEKNSDEQLNNQLISSHDLTQLEEQAKQKISQFATTLQGALKGAIQEGGLINGVSVCKEKAPEIANVFSVEGWNIARTSLKARNEQNVADDWELANLHEFEKALKNGKPISSLSKGELIGKEYRYMKAIPTKQICLACHGQSIEKELTQTINKLYINDQATGFSLGDIRGAFTLTKQVGD